MKRRSFLKATLATLLAPLTTWAKPKVYTHKRLGAYVSHECYQFLSPPDGIEEGLQSWPVETELMVEFENGICGYRAFDVSEGLINRINTMTIERLMQSKTPEGNLVFDGDPVSDCRKRHAFKLCSIIPNYDSDLA